MHRLFTGGVMMPDMAEISFTAEDVPVINNVEKLVSLSRPENDSIPTLKQILTELEREERPRLARKGQMRRTGRNQ